MGQAKQRGTKEQREMMAVARNKAIEESLHKLPQNVQDYQAKHGTRRLVGRLAAVGALSLALSPSLLARKDENGNNDKTQDKSNIQDT